MFICFKTFKRGYQWALILPWTPTVARGSNPTNLLAFTFSVQRLAFGVYCQRVWVSTNVKC